jgi:hypothetical protein
MLDPRHLEPALTEKEVILRDAFVAEYLKDFDAYQACLRLGFQATYAVQWAHTLFNDGYVQRKITYITRVPESSPEQDALDRAMIEVTLRKVMQKGSDSARVAAAREFRALKGWGEGDGGVGEDLEDMFRRVAQQLPA